MYVLFLWVLSEKGKTGTLSSAGLGRIANTIDRYRHTPLTTPVRHSNTTHPGHLTGKQIGRACKLMAPILSIFLLAPVALLAQKLAKTKP